MRYSRRSTRSGALSKSIQTLDHLDAARVGDIASAGILARLIAQLPGGLTRPARPRTLLPAPAKSTARLACLPPKRALLNVRPYAKTSGPRHVPIMASANGVPFLRVTKPQPPALSWILNHRIDQKTAIFDLKIELGNWWLPMAKQEDEWDALVNFHASKNVDGPSDGTKWVDAIRLSEKENQDMYERDQAKDRYLITKMQKIVDAEMELALKEGQTIVRGRKHHPLWVMKP